MAQVSKNKLEKLYIKEKLPIMKIADRLGFCRATISRWMDEYNIKKRKRSEVIKLIWENMDEEQKEKQVEAARKKTKEMAKEGKHPFQIVWQERPEEMRAIVREHIPEVIAKRTNGMKGVTGSNHPNWNPNLTMEEREKNRRDEGYSEWRIKVFKRDNYICQVCGSKKDIKAHHLESYKSNLKLRIIVNNGVTLCGDCHKQFHREYGYGNNTAEQFEEFKAVVCCD